MSLLSQTPDAAVVTGSILIGIGVYVLWRAHRKKVQTDITDIVIDSSLNPPRITQAKVLGFFAFLFSTWWLTVLVMKNQMSAEYFWAYSLTWGVVKVAGDFAAFKESRRRRDWDRGIEEGR